MKYSLVLGMILLPVVLPAEALVEVKLHPSVVRNIGGVTEFDRNQFITIHEGPRNSRLKEYYSYLEDELDVRYGRDGGSLSGAARGVPADPDRPDFPDIEQMKLRGAKHIQRSEWRRDADPLQIRNTIICTHPERMHPMPENDYTEWGPRTMEGVAEFYAHFLKYYFTDETRPAYLEVLNEPFVHADEIGTTAERMAEQHVHVAKRVRELNPDVMIGGYTAAWIEVEQHDFRHWFNWEKMFIDTAGEEMDFFSYHTYDGVNVTGEPRNRTGANTEGIMDLFDTYSFLRLGAAKPQVISEYGKIPEGGMANHIYSSERTAGQLYSLNGQLIMFMDHPDRIMKTVPFILGKGLWTYRPDREKEAANPFLLWRMKSDGSFVETELSLFYHFWKGVSGQWRWSSSSNPDVRVHLLADGKKLNLILVNLDSKEKKVNLTGLPDIGNGRVSFRSLETHGKAPRFHEGELKRVPDTVKLHPGHSMLLNLELEKAMPTRRTVREHRVYATDYMKDIVEGEAVAFTFPETPTGKGSAFLRITPGREKGLAILPDQVRFNGEPLEVPDNWAGDEQKGRSTFFGTLAVPVPVNLLREVNEVEIVYPDSGGRLACAVLQVNLLEE
ncbi:beta-agarase [Verrucomicrobia bacterium S94]|nr:beta-agarase [Verrucomicrobia bacterium S94]